LDGSSRLSACRYETVAGRSGPQRGTGRNVDNSQFTEEQRTEAYRTESMEQMVRQTRALESIRSILTFFTVIFVIGAVIFIMMSVAAAQTGSRY
jgi:hypothetical protein